MQPEAQDEIGFSAWISLAEPGASITYHQGFLAVDATAPVSKLSADHRRRLRDLAAAAARAAEQNLVHLVQARLGPDRFAYRAIARPRPALPSKSSPDALRPAASALLS
jgi:hypothetical protein